MLKTKDISTNLEIIVTEFFVESRKNLDPDLEQKEKTKKSGSVGRPTNPDLEQKYKKRPSCKRSGLAKT
jgi:hypothetical protein